MLVPFPTEPVASGFEPTLHVTLVLVVPVTAAVNCNGLPTATVGFAGLILTVIAGAGLGAGVGVGTGAGVGVGAGAGVGVGVLMFTVTAVTALFVVSAAEVALT